MKALLLPKILRPGSPSKDCELIARTGGDKITVRVGQRVFAVNRWRLHSADGRRRVAPEEFDMLPWQGRGDDPKLTRAAAPSLLDTVRL